MRYFLVKYTFMFCVVTIFGLLTIGCADPDRPKVVPPPPPQPKIKVEQYETDATNALSVYYLNHSREVDFQRNFVGNPYVNLNNIEQVRAYKKQVEFLLKSLEDAERKMNTHEDGQEATSP